ncbi:tRNA(Ile)-lysidine synthase [bacterium BMS3Abin15]|nr:tRNA(Ile)-lysidine synthase [bacterium BMS3Abin15]HDH07698.1 tRNA lysidine(34) synthetase TilS [Candidatus Moranbacteria bacterium]HDZ85052.1 tRNA lysidine(34) synthetase TilS [Candidatus Moranbacteria bacterium]
MANLVKKTQNIVFQNNLWKNNSKIIVGVSGGSDSVCLLDILNKLKLKYNLKFYVTHVNYGLRGKDSNKDEKFVRNSSEKYGLGISVLKTKKQKKISESILREIRYDFFEKIRKQKKFDLIAVAHNLDDQVETFLMRVIRGSGLAGLSSMKYKNNKIIRPLLGITRKEIADYLKNNKLKYRIDKTNKENLFLRNKIRNNLIPYLEKGFNPSIKKTIFNSIAAISDDYSLISNLSEKKSQKNEKLNVKKILKLHPALQRMAIRKTLSRKKYGLRDIESSHIEEILKALRSKKNKHQTVMFKGLKLVRKGDNIHISIQTS